MALDPTIPLRGTMTNPDALVQAQNISSSQQDMAQSRQMQPLKVKAAKQQIAGEDLTQLQKKNEITLGILRTVVDQPSYDKARQYAASVGLDTSRFPDAYDPNVIKQAQYGAMTAAQAINNMLRESNQRLQAGIKTGDPTQFQPQSIMGTTPPAAKPAGSYGLAPPAEQADEEILNEAAATYGDQQPTAPPSNVPPPLPPAAAAPTQSFPADAVQPSAASAPVQAPQSGIPVKGPTETVQAYDARLKASGDIDTIKIMDAAAAEGKPITYTQATALKQGKMTALQNGEVQPLPGAMKTEAAMESNKTAAGKKGEASSAITDEINSVADQALYTKRIATEMKQLSQGLTTGNLAPLKAKLGAWAVALGLPEDQISQELGNVGDAQAMSKLTAQLATQAMKTFTNRGTQMEFATFMANNPNIAMTPDGFNKVIDFVDKTADMPLQKQAQFMEWKRGRAPEEYQDFSAAWNQHMLKNMQSTLTSPATPQADEWNTTPSGIKYKKVTK